MLNSIYGRFGMSHYLEYHTLINSDEVEEFSKHNIIKDIYILPNGKELISNTPLNQGEVEEPSTLSSVTIAAAITAGARTHMNYLKIMDGYTLYYSDTDSIDLDKPLPSQYVGYELGQLKLEHIFDEAVYLAPKM